MSVGERILELRKKQNISQIDMAQSMGVSRQAVSKWESDKSCPDTLKLIQLAEFLNTEVEYLATGRHPNYKSPDIHVTLIKKPENAEPKVTEKPAERIVERIVEKPVIRRVTRIKYKYHTDYRMVFLVGIISLVTGILLGLLF